MMIKIKKFFYTCLFSFIFICFSAFADNSNKIDDNDLSAFLNKFYKFDQEFWFGAYLKDQNGNDIKIGYATNKIERSTNEDGDNLLFIKFNWFLNFINYGVDNIIKLNVTEVFQSDPPFNFLNSSSLVESKGFNSVTVSTLDKNKLSYLELENNKIIKLNNDNINYKLNDILVFEVLSNKYNFEVGDTYFVKSLDKNKIKKDKYTILEVNNVTIDGIPQKYYKIETTLLDSDDVEYPTIFYGNKERIISFDIELSEGIFLNFRLEPKDDAADLSYVADLYILQSIQLDNSFNSKESINYLYDYVESQDEWVNKFDFEITGKYDDIFSKDYINQNILNRNGKTFLKLGFNENFTLEKVSKKDFEDAKLYQDEHPTLRKIVTTNIDANSEDTYKIEQLMNYVYENTSRFADYKEVTDPYEILERGGGDCTEISDLFISLSKSIGIPARPIRGYAFGFEDYSFGAHQWAEVAINGNWYPVDPTFNMWGDFSTFHIKVDDFSKSSNSIGSNFKLKLVNSEISNGEIIYFNDDGSKTIE